MAKFELERSPLFQALSSHKRILLAGAGGGFDIFSGLPLYFRLRALGHQVWLANYSFTQLHHTPEVEQAPALCKVLGDSDGPTYFPERYLAQWLDRHYEENNNCIYTFKLTGVKPLIQAYEYIQNEIEADAVVLVDGGTDSLMRGDEDGLGTPVEDITSIAAVSALEGPAKYLSAIGFGVDTFHGVCHHYFLEAVAAAARKGQFLGAFSLLAEFEEAYLLKQAADYVFSCMPEHKSIVLSSILNACLGRFGDVHATKRTQGSQLYINPLMSLYWNFELEAVVERNLYLHRLLDTQNSQEVAKIINLFRHEVKERPWKELPV